MMMVWTTVAIRAQEIPINENFAKDTLLMPFSGIEEITGLKASGTITLLTDSSLVRVVLIDESGTKRLVYEAYPLIVGDSILSIDTLCYETCFLDRIKPFAIRLDLVNASISLTSFSYTTLPFDNPKMLQDAAKWRYDSVVIRTMNQRIVQEKMYWRAGRTSITEMPYDKKENMFGKKFNLVGFDYYRGGIFEWSFRRVSKKPTTSAYVSSFDWRSRHGADEPSSPYYDNDTCGSGWLTNARDQLGKGTCYVFCPVGAVEARLNLFYNIHGGTPPHHADIDISEQDVWKCQPIGYCDGGLQFNAFTRLKEAYRCYDTVYPYDISACNHAYCSKPTGATGIVKIQDFQYFSNTSGPDSLKEYVISKGPLGVMIPYFPETDSSHYVVLSGYSNNPLNKKVYHGVGQEDSDIVLDSNCAFLDNESWSFKNSWGNWGYRGHGFGSILYPLIGLTDCYYPSGTVYWLNHNPQTDVVCTDEDSDGYYWWGIGPRPSSYPAGTSALEDCDDSDPNKGPYNVNAAQGLLYDCITDCGMLTAPQTISSSCTLALDTHINRTIIIASQSVLTITGTVRMHKDAKILVSPGATLKVSQTGRITSACSQLWHGIRVFGDSTAQNQNQGVVQIEGSIENAKCAIKDTTISNSIGFSGAIIKANGALFKNNRSAIELVSYYHSIDSTKFFNCTFQADSSLIDGSLPDQLVKLTGLSNNKCVKFEGCTFKQTAGSQDVTGIYAYNANFLCTKYISGTMADSTLFQNLHYGAYVISDQSPGVPFQISDSRFLQNYRCVFASAITGAHFLSNNVNLPLIGSSTAPHYSYTAYGLYLEACRAYHVENNNFHKDPYSDQSPPPGYVATCGTFINNSGPYENEIYRNVYTGLDCAVAAYRENRSDTVSGLMIKCNTFTDNIIDIGIFRGTLNLTGNMGVRFNQGFLNAQSSDSSAGNIFTSSSYQYHLWDIVNYSNSMRYNHHNKNSTFQKVQPDANFTNNSEIHENTGSFFNSTSCPATLSNDDSEQEEELRFISDSLANVISSISDLIDILEDGGNTDSLNQLVLISNPLAAIETYSTLIGYSPYLSDTVIKSTIAKEEVFPNAMVRDIMVANPHLSKNDSVLSALDTRFIPMPDSLYAEILEGQALMDIMDTLVYSRNAKIAPYDANFNALINCYLTDTINDGVDDSLKNLLKLDYRLSSKYLLALRYLDLGEIDHADSLISDITQGFSINSFPNEEYNNFLAYYTCKKNSLSNGNLITTDSTLIESLYAILQSDTGYRFLPTVLVRNALINAGSIAYDEPLVFDPSLPLLKAERRKLSKGNELVEYLKVFPNPAQQFVILDYQVRTIRGKISIYVTSLDGKQLDVISLEKHRNQALYITKTLNPGTYLFSLFADKHLIQSQKLLISK